MLGGADGSVSGEGERSADGASHAHAAQLRGAPDKLAISEEVGKVRFEGVHLVLVLLHIFERCDAKIP